MTFSLLNLQLHVSEKTVCNDFSLSMQAGEIWSILGKNGVGKTSFLHALCGIRKLTRGMLLYDTCDLLTASSRSRAESIGLLSQDQDFLFPTSVHETVLAGRYPHTVRFIGEREIDYKITADILQKLDLEKLASRNILSLSGGEKRRAAIGTLLAQAPNIYLLDEPSNHLDIHYQIKVLDIFKKLAHEEGKIIIMVTHDLNLAAKYSDKVMLFFENESILAGDKTLLLTEQHLSKLFNHPIHGLCYQKQNYFFA